MVRYFELTLTIVVFSFNSYSFQQRAMKPSMLRSGIIVRAESWFAFG